MRTMLGSLKPASASPMVMHAGEGQRRDHEQRHGVHARPVDREHGDRCREHKQDEDKILVHHGFLHRAMG